MVNKCVSLEYKLSIVIAKKHLHSFCQSVNLQKFQTLEEYIELFCTEALLTWMCFALPCTNLYLIKNVLVSVIMDKFRQVSSSTDSLQEIWLEFFFSFLLLLFFI